MQCVIVSFIFQVASGKHKFDINTERTQIGNVFFVKTTWIRTTKTDLPNTQPSFTQREQQTESFFTEYIYFSVFKSNPAHINIPESNAHGFSRGKNRERKYEKKKKLAARGGNILLNHHL